MIFEKTVALFRETDGSYSLLPPLILLLIYSLIPQTSPELLCAMLVLSNAGSTERSGTLPEWGPDLGFQPVVP